MTIDQFKKIATDLFTKQSPLSAAQFEAAFRTHPDVDVEDLTFVRDLGKAGGARLKRLLTDGFVTKNKILSQVVYSLPALTEIK